MDEDQLIQNDAQPQVSQFVFVGELRFDKWYTWLYEG